MILVMAGVYFKRNSSVLGWGGRLLIQLVFATIGHFGESSLGELRHQVSGNEETSTNRRSVEAIKGN
jgi:hypothetical protein